MVPDEGPLKKKNLTRQK